MKNLKKIRKSNMYISSDLKYYFIWNTITCLLLLVYPPTLLQGDKNLFQREIFITGKKRCKNNSNQGKKTCYTRYSELPCRQYIIQSRQSFSICFASD